MRWLDGISDWLDWVWASSGSWWWTGKSGVLQSMGSLRVRHDWSDLAAAADSILKSRHYFANKGPSSQSYGFSSSHVWMWELDYKERWALKNRCFWTVVLYKTLVIPLDSKEIQSVCPKADQSWVFIGRTDVEAETPILWPLDVKSWLIWKELDSEKDWRHKEKWTTEDEMVGWHYRLNGHGFGWALGVGDG